MGMCLMMAVLSAAPAELWVLPHDPMPPAEQLLVQTVQGLANRKSARVWLDTGGMSEVILRQLKAQHAKVHAVDSVWELLKQFKGDIKGAVACKLGTESVNVATSLCGPMSAVAVDEMLLESPQRVGLVLGRTLALSKRQPDAAHQLR